ncbi:MAG: hypothetical protein JNK58_01575 [Phycisphaerae bacterium]|nr:hypothetical protein [Phycisphaerae bacterium]
MGYLGWSFVFLAVALLSGVVGFRPMGSSWQVFARACFVLSVFVFLLFLVLALIWSGTPASVSQPLTGAMFELRSSSCCSGHLSSWSSR